MSKPYAKVVAPFRFDFLELMDLRPIEAEMVLQDREKYQALAEVGDGGVILHDGIILAAFGWIAPRADVLEVWLIPSVHIHRFPAIFLRTVRRYIDSLFEALPTVRRIQSTAIDDRFHSRWMRYLGFQNETPNGMAEYGAPGQAYNMWARFRCA